MAEPYVRLNDIKALLDMAADLGVSAPEAIRSELPSRSDGTFAVDAGISIADYFRLQSAIAHVADDLTASISSRRLTFRTGHFIVSQMQHANSLLSTMENLVEHINMMHGDAYNSLRISENTVSLVINDSKFPYRFQDDQDLLHLIGDCLLIKIYALFDSLTKGNAHAALKRVRLKRGREAERQPQNTFWTVPIDYGHPNYELVFDFDEACRSVQVGDSVDLSPRGFYSRVISYLEAQEFSPIEQTVTARTVAFIEDGCASQSDIAAKLDISVATLRRRLLEEGHSFRDLLLDTQLRRAEVMLKRGYSVAQTSEQLNYSDIRAFNRAFKRWKGVTPAAFAQSVQAAGEVA